MSTLKQFLKDNPVGEITADVIISERLRDFPFRIRAMSASENSKYGDMSTRASGNGKVKFDSDRNLKLVILNHCVEPNFKDEKDIKEMGCTEPAEYLDRALLAGEQEALYVKIRELSGFKSFEELKDEVKN